ncbi:MAG: protein kinase [bacterium]|nr:protein kinase [bacterium]
MTNTEDRLAELLARALELRDRGEPVDLAELCRDAPDLVSTLGDALGLRADLTQLHGQAHTTADLTGRVMAERYRLEECIGQGAVGMVFRAHDQQLGRDVAVKLLHHGLFAAPEVETRFRREAEVLAQHEHRHVMRIYDQGTAEDGTAFLVTELLHGTSLQSVLDAAIAAMPNGPSSAAFAQNDWLAELLPEARLENGYLRQVVTWIAQLAAGLQSAHEHGVFHRDIKPSNAFVRADGSAVLLDFGIATRTGDPAVTLPHAIIGTPSYMAPEQAGGRSEPRPALDVYGLTATLYHLLTLRPPHDGDLQTVLEAVRTSDPAPAASLHPGLPRDLAAVLDRGLEHEPDDRYADAPALAADLDAFLAHRPVSARPIGRIQRFVRHCRRRPARTAAALLATLLAIALTLLLPLWATVEARANTDEFRAGLAHLPADIAVEGWPDQRALVPLTERTKVIAELDHLLELQPHNRYVRVLRAAERLDGGDAAGAAADFAELERQAPSAYLREVAGRYRAVAERLSGPGAGSGSASAAATTGHRTIDLEDLPEPTRDSDFFLAGFHALRAWRFPEAAELLGRCVDFVPARDLRLLALIGQRRPDPELLLAEAAWLEGHYGHETARTQHVRAVAMIFRREYGKAIPLCRRALELRPDRHGPWNNLGLALLRTGQLEEAETALRRAVQIREWFPNSLANLAQCQRHRGDFAGAETTLARMADVAYREHELGNVDLDRAIATRSEDEPRRHHAAAALAHFERARAAAADPDTPTRHPNRRAIPSAIAYARAMAHPDRRIAAIAHMVRMSRQATNPQHLANLAGLLEDLPFDPVLRDEVRLFLLEIATTLAPGKTRIRDYRDELRKLQSTRR